MTQLESDRRERLLTDDGVSAGPRTGTVVRLARWGQKPFITVWQATSPISTQFQAIGDCRLVGALDLLVEASPVSGDTKIPAGVYLLALSAPSHSPPTLSLLSLRIKDGLARCERTARIPVGRERIRATGDRGVSVSFPGKDEASNEDPAWRATTTIWWPDLRLDFQLNLDITMI